MVIDLLSEQTDIRISRAMTSVLLLFFLYKSKVSNANKVYDYRVCLCIINIQNLSKCIDIYIVYTFLH